MGFGGSATIETIFHGVVNFLHNGLYKEHLSLVASAKKSVSTFTLANICGLSKEPSVYSHRRFYYENRYR
jgi:hypothetical protein